MGASGFYRRAFAGARGLQGFWISFKKIEFKFSIQRSFDQAASTSNPQKCRSRHSMAAKCAKKSASGKTPFRRAVQAGACRTTVTLKA